MFCMSHRNIETHTFLNWQLNNATCCCRIFVSLEDLALLPMFCLIDGLISKKITLRHTHTYAHAHLFDSLEVCSRSYFALTGPKVCAWVQSLVLQI